MGKIIEAANLPEGDKVYLKKEFPFLGGGYRIVYPVMNEDGTFNWRNLIFGNVKGLLMIVIFIALLIWSTHETKTNLAIYKAQCDDIVHNPVKFCTDIQFYNTTTNKKNNLQGLEGIDSSNLRGDS